MSNENETEETEKKGKVITIKHEFKGLPNQTPSKKGESPEEVETLRKSLKEKTEILSLIALREFEIERDRLLEVVPENKRGELSEFVDSPEKLETMRKIYSPKEETSTAPSGKATISPVRTPSETPTFDLDKKYSDPMLNKISDLYDVIGSNKSSAEEKQKAERVLDKLYLEMRKGLKARKDRGELDYVYPKTGRYGFTCQSCGKAVQSNSRPETGIPCPHCGYKFGVDPVPTHPQ